MGEKSRRVVVVMPAYNAKHTIDKTVQGLPMVYDDILLCDDASTDGTAAHSVTLGIPTVVHQSNKGYGANQKTLYSLALEKHPYVIVMVHPDNQYNTSGLPEMIAMVQRGETDMVLGSRMKTALKNKMPWWKYCGNRFLTVLQNAVFGTRLSEFHSGLRIYRADVLRAMPYQTFSDRFVFDSEVIAWLIANGHRLREYPTECYYNDSVSSVSFKNSVVYGFATLRVLIHYLCGGYRA